MSRAPPIEVMERVLSLDKRRDGRLWYDEGKGKACCSEDGDETRSALSWDMSRTF